MATDAGAALADGRLLGRPFGLTAETLKMPSAGDVSHEGLLKPERRGISRVCVKASPAFGRRRLHRNTDWTILIVPHVIFFLDETVIG